MKFSLIMPAYNAEETIEESLDHIISQTYSDWELLIVDDGSTDSTAAIAERYAHADSRVRVLSKANGGVASVYNYAIPKAAGDYIVITPSDDLIYAQHLQTFAEATERLPDFDIFCSNGERLYESGERATTYRDAQHASARELPLIEVIDASFFAVGVAYRRDLFDRLGGYRTDVYGEDWDFWLRAMKQQRARVWYIPEVLAANRIRLQNKSADLAKVYESNIEILKDFRNQNELTSKELAMVEVGLARWCSLAERERTWVGRVRRKTRERIMVVVGVERVERVVAWLKGGER